jgi:hypothetical protein
MGVIAKMVSGGTISNTDLDLLLMTDSVQEAMDHIQRHAVKSFGLDQPPKGMGVLGEESPLRGLGSRVRAATFRESRR